MDFLDENNGKIHINFTVASDKDNKQFVLYTCIHELIAVFNVSSGMLGK